MTSQQIAELTETVHLSLASDAGSSYGRGSEHAFGPCPQCRIHVCLAHHIHPERETQP